MFMLTKVDDSYVKLASLLSLPFYLQEMIQNSNSLLDMVY